MEGGAHVSPASGVFFTPLCLCTCYSLFLWCPSHHLHLKNPICVLWAAQGLHIPSTLLLTHGNLLPLRPRLEISISVLALIPCCSVEKTWAFGPRTGSATMGYGAPEKVAHLENGRTFTLPADPTMRIPG